MGTRVLEAPISASYEGTFVVTSTINASTTATITASGSCSNTGATVTITAPSGTCSLTAKWAADNHYLAASAMQSTTATKAMPVITWATPAVITYGTALSGTQLNATATCNGTTVAGTFGYTPAKDQDKRCGFGYKEHGKVTRTAKALKLPSTLRR